MLAGTVKHFDCREGKMFGFITYEGQDVFFHSSFGGTMGSLGGNTPVFIPSIVSRSPKIGDSVLFEMSKGPKGMRATKWCFADTYLTALEQIAARRVYRMVERHGVPNPSTLFRSGQATYKTVYEGNDLDALRISWPQSDYPCQDSFTFERYFEVAVDDGFVAVSDPR